MQRLWGKALRKLWIHDIVQQDHWLVIVLPDFALITAGRFRDSYAGDRTCPFVSDENRDIMQTQLAMRLENAWIVENPFNVRFDANPPWRYQDCRA